MGVGGDSGGNLWVSVRVKLCSHTGGMPQLGGREGGLCVSYAWGVNVSTVAFQDEQEARHSE